MRPDFGEPGERLQVPVRFLSSSLIGFALLLGSAASAREWTDVTGKFKYQGELVAVRAGKVILEKADGTIISIALEKLSAADRAFLKSQDKPAPAPAASSKPASSEPAPSKLVRALNAAQEGVGPNGPQAVLRANCYRCHGEDGASEGGFNFAQNLP